MRWVGVIVAFGLVFDLPATGGSGSQAVAATVDNAGGAARHSDNRAALAECTETISPSPLSPRPALRRATYAAKPSLPRRARAKRLKRHHARSPHKRHLVRHAKRKPVHHAHHRPAARHPRAARRAVVHRVTYALPACGQRTEMINDLLGLPGVTQPPIAAESIAATAPLPIFIDLPPAIGPGPGPIVVGGPVGPGPIIFPGGPTYPVGPGPIIIGPPGPPIAPPISPVTPSVPEPGSWATMLSGLMLVGAMRRRAARARLQ